MLEDFEMVFWKGVVGLSETCLGLGRLSSLKVDSEELAIVNTIIVFLL